MTPGILHFALRASLRLFEITPGDFVEPLDFIARLVALVPKRRVDLTRFLECLRPTVVKRRSPSRRLRAQR
jgi:hypothetical protein